jgi:hypothetical protein
MLWFGFKIILHGIFRNICNWTKIITCTYITEFAIPFLSAATSFKRKPWHKLIWKSCLAILFLSKLYPTSFKGNPVTLALTWNRVTNFISYGTFLQPLNGHPVIVFIWKPHLSVSKDSLHNLNMETLSQALNGLSAQNQLFHAWLNLWRHNVLNKT